MRIMLSIIVCMCCAAQSFAQQTPLYSLYTHNMFMVNPAYAGTQDYAEMFTNSRYQFVGIENAPVTTILSLCGPHASLPMGWGGMIFNDNQGALSKFAVYGAYSYAVPLTAHIQASFGIHAGVMQHRIDLTKVRFLHTEYGFDEHMYTSLSPDATFGTYVYAHNFYAGFVLDQLFGGNLYVYNDTVRAPETFNKLLRHSGIMGGYVYPLKPNIIVEPHVFIRKSAQSPLQVEAGAQISYNSVISFGTTLRTGGACIMNLHYNYRDFISFAYAFDITYSALRKDTFGTHEIMLGLRFNTIKLPK
jgi:type IX secretion system PorP/SprF family membrane protein